MFGVAHARHFRPGVHHVGNQMVVDVRLLARQGFGHQNAFFLRFVRQHRTAHHVANGVDVGHRGLQVVVYGNAAAFVRCQTGCGEVQTVGVGASAHGNQAVITGPGNRLAFFVDGTYGDFVAGPLHGFHLGGQLQVHALFLQHALHFLAHGHVHGGEQGICVFNNGNFRAQAVVHGAHLQANDAAANHD